MFFQEREDGFAALGRCGGPGRVLFRIKGTILPQCTSLRFPKWQDLRIIQAEGWSVFQGVQERPAEE